MSDQIQQDNTSNDPSSKQEKTEQVKKLSPELEKKLEKCASILSKAKRIVVFTGAGMSAESGIATFRGDGGLWSGFKKYIALPFFGTPLGWNTLTRLTWAVFVKYFYNPIAAAKPNPGHIAIGELHRLKKNVKVVTQNVDGLHQAGGSPEDCVFEVHGTVRKYRCLNKGHPYTFESKEIPTSCPTCKQCGSYIRPDCVLFTESLPERDWNESIRAVQELDKNDVMIIVGTSSTVYPAASLPSLAAECGAYLFEVNLEPTSFSRLPKYTFLQGGAGTILPELVERMKRYLIENEKLKSN